MNRIEDKRLLLLFSFSIIIITTIVLVTTPISPIQIVYSDDNNDQSTEKMIGVNMKGMYTSRNYESFPNNTITSDYYEESFKLIKSIGMNHIRYVLYWEAYENNPSLFLKELKDVATLADQIGLKIIYDNHQYHTSNWLDEKRGTGFPSFLFDKKHYPFGSDVTGSGNFSKLWWTNWWDRYLISQNNTKIDGWALQADFLKTIVKLLDNHSSTIGYEILNEPQIFSKDQWSKIGNYYKYMIDELRNETEKTLVVDMTIPITFKDSSINLTSENMAKIIPKDEKNSIFKISLYGIPKDNNYHEKKLELLSDVSKLKDIPLYVGEWNNVEREKENISNNSTNLTNDTSKINITSSDLTQKQSNLFIKKFEALKVWGWAFWNWNYVNTPPENFNLINVTQNGDIHPTKYFHILEKSINK